MNPEASRLGARKLVREWAARGRYLFSTAEVGRGLGVSDVAARAALRRLKAVPGSQVERDLVLSRVVVEIFGDAELEANLAGKIEDRVLKADLGPLLAPGAARTQRDAARGLSPRP